MPTPAEIIDIVAPLQNDTAKTRYTYDACLPYLNIALAELQEVFEENNIPISNQTSAALVVPAGTTAIAFTGTIPVLPTGLIEIYQLWESDNGGNDWIPMERKDFIPHYLEDVQLAFFGIWAWIDNEIRVPAATGIIDLKLDYIKSIFPIPLTMENINVELGIKFKNITTHLGYATAALCSMFIGENETRAGALKEKADEALERALNIPTKGRQSILTRRRPFRASYKMRGVR